MTREWKSTEKYQEGSIVMFNNKEYIRLGDNVTIGKEPDQSILFWKLTNALNIKVSFTIDMNDGLISNINTLNILPSPKPLPIPLPTPKPLPIPLPSPKPLPIPLPTPKPLPIPLPTPKPLPIPLPTPPLPAYKVLSFRGLTDIQIQVILQLTSIFENSTTSLAYNYAEDINDGRGITFGFVGFCSGTYDGSQVFDEYIKIIGNGDVTANKYFQAMKNIDAQRKGMNPSLVGLNDIIPYINRIGNTNQFIQAQFIVANRLYVKPSQNKAEQLGLTTALSKGQLYDCYLNQGESGGLELIRKAGNVNGDEKSWLERFLKIRYDLLASDRTWKSSVDRITVYQKLITNSSLICPIKVNCYGNSFIINPR